MRNTSLSYKIFTVFNTLFMCLIVLIMLYPFLYVIFASFSDSNALMAHTGLLLKPLNANLEAYKAVYRNPMIISGYKNTLFILIVGVLVNMVMTILAAYVLSRKEFKMKNIFTIYIVFTMFFSGGLIPLYLTVRDIGLDNTTWALIIPTAMSAYNMIIMRTSFGTVPDSLIESAKLDGATHLQVLFHIVLPLSKAVLAVIALYYAVGHWNSWFNAMIFLRDRSKFPLQLIMREILLQNDTTNMNNGVSSTGDAAFIRETIQYAVIVVATIPILFVYPFVQKYFVKGVMIGAIKE